MRTLGLLIVLTVMLATPAVVLAQDQVEVAAIKTVIESMAKAFNKAEVPAMRWLIVSTDLKS